jgi:hypothetical protein
VQADLAAVDRSVTPWIVVMGHRPFYCTSYPAAQCDMMSLILRDALGDMFWRRGVDVVIQVERDMRSALHTVIVRTPHRHTCIIMRRFGRWTPAVAQRSTTTTDRKVSHSLSMVPQGMRRGVMPE